MTQHPLVSPHDCAGSNLFGHVLRGRLMRVVPRANEEINETWIADRDRYSCEGLYAEDRAQKPMVKRRRRLARGGLGDGARGGGRRACSRSCASTARASSACWCRPTASTEEACLAARVARGLGSENVDHRLRRQDFRDQSARSRARRRSAAASRSWSRPRPCCWSAPNVRREVPIIAHRLRKGAVRRGTQVAFINTRAGRRAVPGGGEPRQQRLRHGAARCRGAGRLRCVPRAAPPRRTWPRGARRRRAGCRARARSRRCLPRASCA